MKGTIITVFTEKDYSESVDILTVKTDISKQKAKNIVNSVCGFGEWYYFDIWNIEKHPEIYENFINNSDGERG